MLDFKPLVKNKSPSECRIIVAMSGGVDSSTVAAYLHKLGYNVIGVTLQLYSNTSSSSRSSNETDASAQSTQSADKKSGKTCCAGQDIYDAKRVAEQFGFLHYVINLEKTFKKEVIEDFADSYIRGKTPIPCVKCNQTVKFRDLLAIAKQLKADALVTGHYVERLETESGPELHKAKDLKKDQSYFLFATTKEQLDFLRFPLGSYKKEETRELASALGLKIADKPESQDICFVSKSYAEFINKLRPESCVPGEIRNLKGEIMGQHKGIINYTVGQRHGLNISHPEPLYVVKIDKESNQIIVGPKAALERKIIYVKDINWLATEPFQNGMEAEVKLRSGAQTVKAYLSLEESITETIQVGSKDYYSSGSLVSRLSDSSNSMLSSISNPIADSIVNSSNSNNSNSNIKGFKIELQELPSCAVSPGQACVIYLGSKVLGGGWIAEV